MASLDRRKVTMISYGVAPDGTPLKFEAVDYVDVEHVDEYAADARTRWGSVVVGDEVDHGPGGVDGEYDVAAATTSPEV